MESSATSPSCSSAKSMIPAPVRAEQMANYGAVLLQTMIKTRNGAYVPTKVRAASEWLRLHKGVFIFIIYLIFFPVFYRLQYLPCGSP